MSTPRFLVFSGKCIALLGAALGIVHAVYPDAAKLIGDARTAWADFRPAPAPAPVADAAPSPPLDAASVTSPHLTLGEPTAAPAPSAEVPV